uniref:Uncharacterized protein n=1 Tax=Oryza glumipatula TaxID=40148 RepID=A0A0E0AQQ1_9ORYZ
MPWQLHMIFLEGNRTMLCAIKKDDSCLLATKKFEPPSMPSSNFIAPSTPFRDGASEGGDRVRARRCERRGEVVRGHRGPLLAAGDGPVGAGRGEGGGAGMRAQVRRGAAADGRRRGPPERLRAGGLARDVPAAVVAVDDCATALLQVFGVNSAWYKTVIGDRDRSMLALRSTGIMLKHPANIN